MARREGKSVPLTERERELLELLGSGLGNQELARRLGISEKTVEMHLSSIYQKLGVKGRTQAVLRYLGRD